LGGRDLRLTRKVPIVAVDDPISDVDADVTDVDLFVIVALDAAVLALAEVEFNSG